MLELREREFYKKPSLIKKEKKAFERKKKHEKTLSLTRKGDKIVYQCWHCQLSGAVNMNKQPTKSTSKKTTPIAVLKTTEVKNTAVGSGEIKQTQKKT